MSYRFSRALVEQLKALGVLEETDNFKSAPSANPEGGYAGEGGPSDEPDDDFIDVANEGENPFADDDEEDEEEMEARAVKAMGDLSAAFLRVHEMDDEEPDFTPTDDEMDDEEPGMGESRKRRLARLAEGRIYRPSPKQTKHVNKVAAVVEQVAEIWADIHRAQRAELIQGFAQIAVISEQLANAFSKWGMGLKSGKMYRVGTVLQRLHEQAADVAVGLDTPPEEKDDDEPVAEQDDAQLEALFKKLMAKLVDALQLYKDVADDEMGDEEPEDDMGDEEPMDDGPVDDEPFPDDEMGDEEPMDGDDEEDVFGDEEDEPEEEASCQCPNPSGVAEARRTLSQIRAKLRLEAKKRTKKTEKKKMKKKTKKRR